ADPAVRAKAYALMERAITLADALGVRVIQLAGYDVYYEPSTPQSVRLFREGMRWSAKKAAQKQVMLAMEIMDTPFMNSISKHMAYESMLHSPWYKVYPDLGNLSAWPENDVDFELSQGVGSIVAVHLKETLPPFGDFPGQFKCVTFGTGCVDFTRRFAQLEALGYAGPYMIEMWHKPDTDDKTEIAKATAWLRERYQTALQQKEE
ncbi:MAG: L-ribulose-5-phosphate 3-epimerase, partial [Ruthenibacterium sp.]